MRGLSIIGAAGAFACCTAGVSAIALGASAGLAGGIMGIATIGAGGVAVFVGGVDIIISSFGGNTGFHKDASAGSAAAGAALLLSGAVLLGASSKYVEFPPANPKTPSDTAPEIMADPAALSGTIKTNLALSRNFADSSTANKTLASITTADNFIKQPTQRLTA